MGFPWGQSTLPSTFICSHCGETHYLKNDHLAVCNCKGSEEERTKQREAQRALVNQRHHPTFAEVRDNRKCSSYRKPKD